MQILHRLRQLSICPSSTDSSALLSRKNPPIFFLTYAEPEALATHQNPLPYPLFPSLTPSQKAASTSPSPPYPAHHHQPSRPSSSQSPPYPPPNSTPHKTQPFLFSPRRTKATSTIDRK